MTAADLLIAGEIGKPHGIQGDVYVVRISDDPHRFDPGARLIHSNGDIFVVEDSRPHRDRFLVKFEGVDSREEAEAIRGTLYIPATEARELEEGEYWEHDLIGCEAFDTAGVRLGEVSGVTPGRAHDLLELRTDAGARLVPMVEDFVIEVDLADKRIVLDPPAGLLD